MIRVGLYPFFVSFEQMSWFVRTELKKFERYIKDELARANEVIITCACASSVKVPAHSSSQCYFTLALMHSWFVARRDDNSSSLTSSRCFIKRIKYRKRRRAENSWILHLL